MPIPVRLNAYLSYYDSNPSTASQRKFKYVGTSGVDDTALCAGKGYWIYVNQSGGGNLTLLSVGGSASGQTYSWSKLRFMNASGVEKNITQAGDAGWVETTLQYWNTDHEDFNLILGNPSSNPALGQRSIIYPWEGIFINGLKDNITLIRQN